MMDTFLCYCICCSDELMLLWLNKYTCPGWVMVLRKPHLFGNEWHNIFCALYKILLHMGFVEGKDHPQQLPGPMFDGLGKTAGLLI